MAALEAVRLSPPIGSLRKAGERAYALTSERELKRMRRRHAQN